MPNFHLESGPLRGTLSPFQVPEDFQNSDLDQNRRERRPREEIETVVYPVKFKIALAHPAKYIVPRGDDYRPRSDDFPNKIMQQQSATNIAPREAVTKIVKAMNPDRGPKSKKNPPEAQFAQSFSCIKDGFPVPRPSRDISCLCTKYRTKN